MNQRNGFLVGWCFCLLQGTVCPQSLYSIDTSDSARVKRANLQEGVALLPDSLQEAIRFAAMAEMIQGVSGSELNISLRSLKKSKDNKALLDSPGFGLSTFILDGNPAKNVDLLSRAQTLNLWEVFPRFISPQLVQLVELFKGPKIDADKFTALLEANRQLANYTDYAGRTIYHIALRFAMEAQPTEDWVGFFEKILTDVPVPLNMPVNLRDKFGNSLMSYVCWLAFQGEQIDFRWLKIAQLVVQQSYLPMDEVSANLFGFNYRSLVEKNLPALVGATGVHSQKMQGWLRLVSFSAQVQFEERFSWKNESESTKINRFVSQLGQLTVFLNQYVAARHHLSEDDAKKVVQLLGEFYVNFMNLQSYSGALRGDFIRTYRQDLVSVLVLAQKFLNPNCVTAILHRLSTTYGLDFFFRDQNLQDLVDQGVSPCFLLFIAAKLGMSSRRRPVTPLSGNSVLGMAADTKGEGDRERIFVNSPQIPQLLISVVELAQVQGFGMGAEHIVETIEGGEFSGSESLTGYGRFLVSLAHYFDPLVHTNVTKNQLLISGGVYSKSGDHPWAWTHNEASFQTDAYSVLLTSSDPALTPDALVEILQAHKDRRCKADALQYQLSRLSSADLSAFLGGLSKDQLKTFSSSHITVLLMDMRVRLRNGDQNVGPAILSFFQNVNENSISFSDQSIFRILEEFLRFSLDFPGEVVAVYLREVFSLALNNPRIKGILSSFFSRTEGSKLRDLLVELKDADLLALLVEHFHDRWFPANLHLTVHQNWEDGFVYEFLGRNWHRLKTQESAKSLDLFMVKLSQSYSEEFLGKVDGKNSFFQTFFARGDVLPPVEFFNRYFEELFKENLNYNSIGVDGNGLLHSIVLADRDYSFDVERLVMKLWRENGANFNLVNRQGRTPLQLAVRLFCERLNRNNPFGNRKPTALSRIAWLVKSGADPFLKGQGGLSALAYIESIEGANTRHSSSIEELKSILLSVRLEAYLEQVGIVPPQLPFNLQPFY